MINLFDVSMALVVALILAAAGGGNLAQITAHMSQHDVTIVTNPGQPDMELIVKRGQKIERLRATGEQGWGRGERLGTAYRLESGEVVYVPEGETQADVSGATTETKTPTMPAPTTRTPSTQP